MRVRYVLPVLLLLGCSSEADDEPECTDPIGACGRCVNVPGGAECDFPTEEALFGELKTGENQRAALCARLAGAGVQSKVRDAFCGPQAPKISGVKDVLGLLGLSFDGPVGLPTAERRRELPQVPHYNGNPNWTMVGHSSSLVRRLTSAVNPRVIVHTSAGDEHDAEPGFVIMGFTRGEQLVEIITHDPARNDLNFFVIRFELPCRETKTCTNADLFGLGFESGWTSWTLYDDDDLKNTVFDCLQCHVNGWRGRKKPRRSLLMFELNSPWPHWVFSNKNFFGWEDTPDGAEVYLAAIEDYVAAHATPKEPYGETYAGIPGPNVVASRPMSLERLIEGNGYGNGFDDVAYDDAGRGLGFFHNLSYPALYALHQSGQLIGVPAAAAEPTDPGKRAALITAYQDFRLGKRADLPDVTDLYRPDQLPLVGLQIQPGLSGPEIIVQACTQCHHSGLDQTISRADFNVDLKTLAVEKLQEAQRRIELPARHVAAMPPFRLRSLTYEERRRAVDYLQDVIDGRDAADGEAPTPGQARFDSDPRALGLNAAVMRAAPGSDAGGLVEYYFTETSGQPGGDDSGWQLTPLYVDIGLVKGTTYSYTVTMRDRDGATGTPSAPATVTTDEKKDYCKGEDGDADCDGLADEVEGMGDLDGDGIPNWQDPDDDNDGLTTASETQDAAIIGNADPDGDGLPAWHDLDSDGDGKSDAYEGGGDTDGDGIPNHLDAQDTVHNDIVPDGSVLSEDSLRGGTPRDEAPDDDSEASSSCASNPQSGRQEPAVLLLLLLLLLAIPRLGRR